MSYVNCDRVPFGSGTQFALDGLAQPVLNPLLESLMPAPLPTTAPQHEELPHELVELRSAIAALPIELRNRLEPLALRVVESTRRRRRILNLVQEALGQLRLDMKYLLFDLEATRRERDDFRRQTDGE